MSKKTYVPSSEQLEQLLEDDDREQTVEQMIGPESVDDVEDDDREQTVEQMIGPEPVDDAEPEEEEWF